MEVHFQVGDTQEHLDFELSSCRSIVEVERDLRAVCELRPQSGLHLSLRPPVAPQLSIPRVFKLLVSLLATKEDMPSVTVHVASENVLDHLYRYLPHAAETAVYAMGRLMVELRLGDIVEAGTGAIVNASNPSLKLGGGVSGAIRDAAGPGLQARLDQIAARREIGAGDVVLTDSFGIHGVRYILHAATVHGTEDVVRQAVEEVLQISDEQGIRSVAFPALGTGTGGLSIEACAGASHAAIRSYLTERPRGPLQRVAVILWQKTDLDRFKNAWCEHEGR